MPNIEAPKRKATISDVARLAGIGKATASRALSGNGSTSLLAREAALKAAKELDFEVNPLAQSLSGGRSQNLVGLFAVNLDLGVGTQKVQHIQYHLSQAGFDVPLYAHSILRSVRAPDTSDLLRTLCRQRPRAIVFKSGNLTDETLNVLREYQQEGGVLVSYNHASPLECDQVIFDEATAMQHLVEHLAVLGHKRIGLRQHGISNGNAQSYLGFVRGMKSAELEIRPNWLWHEGVYEEGGFLLAKAFIKLPPQERPTALCIINDASAAAFIGEMARRGYDVPQQVSVVSFGGMPASRFGLKQITTMIEPVEAIAQCVTRFLRKRLEDKYCAPPCRTIFEGELAVRETTGPPEL